MPRLTSGLALLVLAGCPPKTATSPQPPPVAEGPGCPPASGIYVASYVTNEPAQGRTGWVLPLHAMNVEPGAHVPDYAPLDATAATVSGVPVAPSGTLWLVTGEGAPCRAKLGGYYAARLPGPPASITYGIELDGCAPPADPQDAGGMVLASELAPTGCRLVAPHPVAARLGGLDAQKRWATPTKESPIPPALASLVPPHDCKLPGCETLWAFGQVDIANQPVAWAGAVNWLAIGDPATPCQWKAERWSGMFLPGPDGKPAKVETEHPLALSAVLADQTGAHAALADGPGEYAVYELPSAKVARQVTWMLAPTEAWAMIDHLGPICEPTPADPAPLPKDAKPISPYH